MKRELIGTVLEFPANYENIERNMQIHQELLRMFGPPGVQPGRRWYRRQVYRRHIDHTMYSSHMDARFVSKWILRLYFRNPQDASYVRLKYQ